MRARAVRAACRAACSRVVLPCGCVPLRVRSIFSSRGLWWPGACGVLAAGARARRAACAGCVPRSREAADRAIRASETPRALWCRRGSSMVISKNSHGVVRVIHVGRAANCSSLWCGAPPVLVIEMMNPGARWASDRVDEAKSRLRFAGVICVSLRGSERKGCLGTQTLRLLNGLRESHAHRSRALAGRLVMGCVWRGCRREKRDKLGVRHIFITRCARRDCMIVR